MKKLKKFKEYKRRKRTILRKIDDVPYSWVHTFDKNSPAPTYQVPITKINLGE